MERAYDELGGCFTSPDRSITTMACPPEEGTLGKLIAQEDTSISWVFHFPRANHRASRS